MNYFVLERSSAYPTLVNIYIYICSDNSKNEFNVMFYVGVRNHIKKPDHRPFQMNN